MNRDVITKNAIPDDRAPAVERSYKELKEHRAHVDELLDADKAKDSNTKKLSTAVWVQVYANPNQYILNEYAKELVKQNYNATIDDHGADFPGQVVNAPVIIFKTDEILKQVGSKKVTELDQKNAYEKYAAAYKELGKGGGYSEFVPNYAKDFAGWENYYIQYPHW